MKVLGTVLVTLLLASRAVEARPLVIGTVADDPTEEISELFPLADYLARRLNEFGIDKGKITVAGSMREMADQFLAGKVDLYIDSPYPSLAVSRASGSKMVLRRWKKGVAEYYSVIYTRKDSGIESLQDLKGKTIAFEEPFSTSSYFLPKNALLSAGLKLKEQKDPQAQVKPSEVGYVFAREDENAMAWLLRGKIAAAATGSTEFKKLAGRELGKLRIIHQTAPVPRHVVSFRRDLDEKLAQKIREILLAMEHNEEGQALLARWSKTTRFDDLPGGQEKALAPLMNMASEIDRELER